MNKKMIVIALGSCLLINVDTMHCSNSNLLLPTNHNPIRIIEDLILDLYDQKENISLDHAIDIKARLPQDSHVINLQEATLLPLDLNVKKTIPQINKSDSSDIVFIKRLTHSTNQTINFILSNFGLEHREYHPGSAKNIFQNFLSEIICRNLTLYPWCKKLAPRTKIIGCNNLEWHSKDLMSIVRGLRTKLKESARKILFENDVLQLIILEKQTFHSDIKELMIAIQVPLDKMPQKSAFICIKINSEGFLCDPVPELNGFEEQELTIRFCTNEDDYTNTYLFSIEDIDDQESIPGEPLHIEDIIKKIATPKTIPQGYSFVEILLEHH